MPTGAETFSEALRIGVEVYAAVKSVMDGKTEEGEDAADLFKGVEGGWALEFDEYDEALQVLTQAVEKAGYTEQVRFVLNLDGNKLLVRPEPASGEEGDGGKASEDEDEEKKYDLGWKASDGSKVRHCQQHTVQSHRRVAAALPTPRACSRDGAACVDGTRPDHGV